MPIICRFYGIIIRMNYSESGHHTPHFHALYGNFSASVCICPPSILAGQLPKHAEKFTLEWAALHEPELMDNWQRASRHESLLTIEPLE